MRGLYADAGDRVLSEHTCACGCKLVKVMRYIVDGRTGDFIRSGPDLVVLPCEDAHLDLAKRAVESVGIDATLTLIGVRMREINSRGD